MFSISPSNVLKDKESYFLIFAILFFSEVFSVLNLLDTLLNYFLILYYIHNSLIFLWECFIISLGRCSQRVGLFS